MQVYFIDNQEYFERKHILNDKKGTFFSDNDERSIFYCRGVIETVNKLGWSPDVVHLQGWMTGLAALYLKKSFKDNPLFANTKIVYSVYDDEFEVPLSKDFAQKALFDGIGKTDVDVLKNPTYANLSKLAIDYSDGVIRASKKINQEVEKHIKKSGKPSLEYQEGDGYIDAFSEFYDAVLEEVAELVD
jgi:starch synthase